MNRPKGTKDNYGNIQIVRDYIKEVVRAISDINNFTEIETPIFESKDVFSRSVGETSDIVSKEMYVFEDKKGREMVLRPEGTAPVVRAIVENKLFANSLPLKLFYYGPMFRYERPQKGRQRQFTQFGVEMISEPNPYADAEIILFAQSILDSLHVKYKLLINSLGDKETRDNYSNALKEYFSKYKNELTEDSLKRLDKNPLRILDDKIDREKDFVKNAPKISDYYSNDTKKYFERLTSFLEKMEVDFTIDQTMVRGLDYYSDTSFEFVSDSGLAGSQSTIIGGGRYSNLVSQFGGPNLSGIGFAVGIERLMNELDIENVLKTVKTSPDIFVINISEEDQDSTLGIVHMLRKSGFVTEWNQKPTKIQKAFGMSEKLEASINVIVGAKELENNKVNVKMNGIQETVDLDNLIEYLDRKLDENENN